MAPATGTEVSRFAGETPERAYFFGVLRPEFRVGFSHIAQSIVKGAWINASAIVEDGDFMAQVGDASVLFEQLGIVATCGCWEEGADNFLIHRESGGACLLPDPTRRVDMAKPGVEIEAMAPMAVELHSWGVRRTRCHETSADTHAKSSGIRVAILDSGVDVGHEAFRDADVTQRSFVDKRPCVDLRGHGTACAGVICGAPITDTGLCYSVSPRVQLYSAKIFGAGNRAPDFLTLAGLNWALSKNCHIISMSLGGTVELKSEPSRVFDFAAETALDVHNALIVAGVGNDSTRPDDIQPVNHPANCEHILGVGALDIDAGVGIWRHSNGSVGVNPDQVDLIAPGVAIRAPIAGARGDMTKFNPFFGTSLAAPFVAGIAALWAGTDEKLRGATLWRRLERSAERAKFPVSDSGAGVVLAPA